MREKIVEMLEMQKALDDRILQGAEYPTEQMKIALFVELGEMMNELPTKFKFWKKTAVDNREKALEEFVDSWHFLMSLNLGDGKDVDALATNALCCYLNATNSTILEEQNVYLPGFLSYIVALTSFYSFFRLMLYLGFTFDELYEGYLKKNKINHERQDNNY